MLNELLINKIINLVLPYKFEKVFILGSKNDLDQMYSILNNYNYTNKIKFELIEDNYYSNEIPDKLIISKDNKLSNESNLLKNFLKNGVQVFTKYSWFEYELNCLPVELLDSEEIFYSKNFFNKKDFEFKIKRVGDILVSSILIVFASPIIFLCGILIWLNDNGPIFYKQQREGLFKEELNIYKLRTMVVNAEVNGPQWAKKNDRRITLVGSILRKTRIDELPQLISVFKGEMSLIGPRPERPEFNKLLEKKIPHYNLRHIIKPGLSGWAQVNYPYSSSYDDSKNKLSYDLFYISNYSIFLDLIILFKTMRTVFSAKGAVPK
jgi:exopolysaccharide biosynthesis polyprenyl glycosylphosphotransferase